MNHQEWQDLFSKIKTLKADFLNHIKDTSLPLNERWELFLSASDGLVEHSSYSPMDHRYPVLSGVFGGEIRWNEEYDLDHGEVFNLTDICKMSNPMMEAFLLKNSDGEDRIKEEILKNGVRLFTFDW